MRLPRIIFRKSRSWKLLVSFSLIILLLAMPLIYLSLRSPTSTEAVWFDDNYAYRQIITFTHNADITSDRRVTITVNTATLITNAKMQSDCDDTRFTNNNGKILRYQLTGTCNNAATTYDVVFPAIYNGGNEAYIYYGNPAAISASQDVSGVTSLSPSGGAPSVGTEEKATAPTLYWKFDDATGTTAQDSTTNNLDGTLNNTPTWQTEDQCISGKCLYMNGTSNMNVSKSDDSKLDFVAADNFTLVAWVKRNGASTANNFIITKAQSGYTGYKLYQDASGDYCFDVSDGTNTDTACTSAVEFDDDQWHHVVGVKTGTTSLTLYVDGKQRATDTSIAATGTLANTGTYYVGVDLDGTSNEWLGFIDEVKIYFYARSAAQVQADFNARSNNEGASGVLGSNTQNQPASLSNGLVGYWKLDESSWNQTAGEVIDASGNGNHGVSYSGTTTTNGKYGNAGSMDGINEGVNLGDDSDFELTTFTISAWVYRTGTCFTFTTCEIFSKGASGNTGYTFLANNTNNYKPSINLRDNQSVVGTTILSTNTWYHVAGSIDGTTVKIYVNGKLETATAQTQTPTFGSEVAKIGNANTNNDLAFQGQIDEVRVYKRALSDADIQTLYNFAPGPVGYWKLDERTGTAASDNSSNGNEATLTNTPTWTQGKFGAGVDFAGSNQHITRADDSDFDFIDDADMSFEAWVKHNTASAQEVILSKYNEAGYKIIMESDGDLTCALDYDSTWTPTDSATSTAATYDDNNWHHVACVKNGASSLLLYIDGVLITTDSSITATNTLTNSDPLYIGIDADGTSNDWIGQIDEVKIYNYARSSKQVIEDMNAGHPAPGSPVGSAVGYWKFDEGADNTCSGGTNDVCNSGNAGTILDGTSTATRSNSGKFGRALNFDGTDDVVTITNANPIDFDTNLATHTFSAWVYADTAGESNVGQIYQKGTNTYLRVDNPSGSSLDIEANLDLATTDANINVSAPITTATWNYIAVTWDGTTLRVYINGVERGSGTGSGAISSDTNNLLIGGTTTANFDGTIDEFKVYNSALTAQQIKADTNRGSVQVLGALSDNSTYQPQAANQEYCVPGDTTSCAAPVGEWKFEEHTGTTAYDTSVNGNNGSFVGGMAWTSGCKIGSCVKTAESIDGVQDKVNIPNPAVDVFDFPPTADYTIESWFKGSSLEADTFPVYRGGSSASTKGYNLEINDDSPLGSANCSYSDGTTRDVAVDTVSVLDNKWHFISCVMDRSVSAGLHIYVDGILKGSDTSLGATINFDNTGSVEIGERNAQSEFVGAVDNVRIYNYARTAAQVAWDYNHGKPVAHWRMDECQGTTINDSSGNSNTGTWSGSAGTYTSAGDCNTSSSSTVWYNGRSGKNNYSLAFDGADDVVNAGSGTSLDNLPAAGMGLSAWIYPTSMGEGSAGVIMAKNVGATPSSGWLLQFAGTNALTLTVDGSTDLVRTTSNNAVTLNAWNHVVVAWDGVITTASSVNIYVNGIGVTYATTTNGASRVSDASSTFFIGNDSTGARTFAGQIDDARAYNYALTATQAKLLYNDGAVRYGPSSGAP